ncbi:MAG: ATP-binding protein [Chitinophagales bacterium]|jgi:signal transduction histidine kinase|nr:ATP-binding protein [Chitinophagales bacterium]
MNYQYLKRLFCLLNLLLLLGSIIGLYAQSITSNDTANHQDEFNCKYYALIICINEYKDEKINDLSFSINDGLAMRDILIGKYYFSKENVDLLTNPTRQEIVNSFKSLQSKNNIDNLLIYYSGLATIDEDDINLTKGNIIPSDAMASNKNSLLSETQIKELLDQVKFSHLLFIADAMQIFFSTSGSFKNQIKPTCEINREKLKLSFEHSQAYNNPSNAYLGIFFPNESLEDEALERGLFSYYLTLLLSENKQKTISASEIYNKLSDKVMKAASHRFGRNLKLFYSNLSDFSQGKEFIFFNKIKNSNLPKTNEIANFSRYNDSILYFSLRTEANTKNSDVQKRLGDFFVDNSNQYIKHNYDSAVYWYEKASENYKIEGIINILRLIKAEKILNYDVSKLIIWLESSLKNDTIKNDNNDLAECYIELAEYYQQKNSLDIAGKYANLSARISEDNRLLSRAYPIISLIQKRQIEVSDIEKKKLELEKQKAETKSKELEAKRLEDLAKQAISKVERDSIQNLAQKARLEAENSKLKEKQIEAQIEESEIKRQQQQYFFYGLAALFILALGFIYYFFQSQRKERKIKEQVQNQAKDLTEKTHKLESLAEELRQQNEVVETKNQELEAISEELRQQSEVVMQQKEAVEEKNQELEALSEELRQQNEVVESRNLELQALQSTKDLMISAVNHDLRNPLNPILNYSQADYPKLSEAARLALIHQRAKVMFALIDDIMDVYRADKLAINPLPNSMYKAVNEAISVISEAKKDLPLIENQVPESALALFEYKYIERVLENLLSNAVKYTASAENGGKIALKAEMMEGKWRVMVIDNGQGIPQDKFEDIFLPFSNPDAKSLGAAKSVGIGLTFCKTMVEAHQSRIGIESEVGKGSTFYFDLLEAPQTTASPAKQSENQTSMPILSEADKTQLQTHLTDLQEFTNNLGDRKLRKLVNTIGGSENIEIWKTALIEAISQLDEAKYTELLAMLL